MRFVQSYTAYSVVFLLYLAFFIFTGFFCHIYINHWTLITAFVSYISMCAVYLWFKQVDKKTWSCLIAGAIITPLIFLGLAAAFGHTYDTGYDGQDYHESAVIELSNKWNPIYEKSQPIKLTNPIDEPVDSGYGKIIWAIDSSIYLLTHNIDSATAINLIVGLLAFSLFYQTLGTLGIDLYLAAIIAFLTIVTTLYVEQIFTFREDSLSYEVLIIGLSSLVLLLKNSQKPLYYLCLLTSLVLLAGTKDSNLFIFLPLSILFLYVVFSKKLYETRSFRLMVVLGFIVGFVTLFNPYITNITRYHSVDYPFNQKSFSDPVKDDGVPLNLRHDGRLQLLYYGIFSSADDGNSQVASSDAHVKFPFTSNVDELVAEASVAAKLVGGYGVFFSGTLTLSIFVYLYLAIRKKSKAEAEIFNYLSLALVLIVLSCLLSPLPNYARYGDQFCLFPISIVVALLLIAKNRWRIEKMLALVLIVTMVGNIIPDISVAYVLRGFEFSTISSQLSSLEHSDKTYLVYAGAFYSSYARLKAAKVKIVISPKPINCVKPITLAYSSGAHAPASTELCKV